MAYTRGTLALISGQTYEPGVPRIWAYKTQDTMATVRAANYFADAKLRGMQPGDLVNVVVVTSGGVPIRSDTINVQTVGSSGATMGSKVLELTATGAVPAGVESLELNHATVVIAATMTWAHPGLFIVKDTSASGTAAHTLTLTGGTFNGTATIATLNARDEFLAVYFDSAGRGQVIVNVGSVALSGP